MVRCEELEELMSDPEVISNTKRYLALSKEEGGMRDVVAAYKKYKQVLSDIERKRRMLRESKAKTWKRWLRKIWRLAEAKGRS